MTHTKGPWTITGKPKGWVFVGNDTKQKIATIIVDDEGYGGECVANARLIAAAPELLEACKAARKHYADIVSAGAPKHVQSVFLMLSDAIAKARG